MSQRGLEDQVLRATAELLDRTGASVSTREVARQLGWSDDRLDELNRLLDSLTAEEYLESKSLHGDNKVLDVQVLRVTSEGRSKLAAYKARWWRAGLRIGRWALAPVGLAALTVFVSFNQDVVVPLVKGMVRQWLPWVRWP